jgi:hypothetical protein
MSDDSASKGKADNTSTELSVARIGLISAAVVAVCGLLGTLITVLGSAISAYISSQAVRDPVVIPIQATQTAEARIQASALNPRESPPGEDLFLVQNHLVLPVRLFLNDTLLDELPAASSRTYPLTTGPVNLRWEIAKETTESGRSIGDDMGQDVGRLNNGASIQITNLVGEQAYFFPTITNHTAQDCEVIVNRGWENENVTNAVVPAYGEAITLGYYRLFTNSNLTLLCGEDTFWWGLQPDESSDDSFYDLAAEDSGEIEFTLNP